MREPTPSRSLPPASRAASPAAGHARRIGLSLVAILSLALPLLLAYEAALARVPHHRAALERVLRAYTGLDAKFATLELHWGWGGPEAVFSQVELVPGAGSPLRMRAERLVIGFNSWASFRRGQLEISRVALVAPDIELVSSRLAGGPEGGGAPPDALTQLLGWLARAPFGRIDIEAGTLRLPATRSSAGPVALSVNRATLRRTPESLSASAYVYLPENLGRSIYLATELHGDLADRSRLRGTTHLVGQRLLLGPWSALLTSALAAPLAGTIDLRARLEYAAGQLAAADGEVTAYDASIARPDTPGRRLLWRRVQARAALERHGERMRLALADVNFARGAGARVAAPANVELDWRPGSAPLAGRAEAVPAQALVMLAALMPGSSALDPLLDLEAQGAVRELRFEFDPGRPEGSRWRFAGELQGLGLRLSAGGFEVRGLEARLGGSEDALELQLGGAAAALRWAPACELAGLAVSGSLRLRRGAAGWQLAGERVRVADPQGEAFLDGVLEGRSGLPVSFKLAADLPALDARRLAQLLPGADGAWAVLARRISSGHFTGLKVDLRATLGAGAQAADLRSAGHFDFTDATLAPAQAWPELTGLEGRVSWGAGEYRVELAHGAATGIALAAARARWREGALPRVEARAYGRLEHLLGWARANAASLPVNPQLLQVAARGDALFDFRLEPRARGAAPHWQLSTFLDRGEVALRGAPPLAQLRGNLAMQDGSMHASRLRGQWLGGPVDLRIQRSGTGAAAVHVHAEGIAEGTMLARLAAQPAARELLAGRTAWHASLLAGAGADWTIEFDSGLTGLESRLPPPLAKAAGESLPLHLELRAEGPDARVLALRLGERGRGLLRLVDRGAQTVLERGTLHLGAEGGAARASGPLRLPARAGLAIGGRVPRLELGSLLALLERTQGASGPADLDLAVGELIVAGQRIEDLHILARPQPQGMTITLSAPQLAGRIDWPAVGASPAQLLLERVRLAGRIDDGELARLAAALPLHGLAVEIRELDWDGLRFGRVSAQLEPAAGALRVAALHAERPAHALQASGRCTEQPRECRLRIELASRDLASTLRDFGLREEVAAGEAHLVAELAWPLGVSAAGDPDAAPGWLGTLSGQLRFEVGAGRLAPASGGERFALFGVAPLYASGLPNAPLASGSVAAAAFEHLSGSFELDRGAATTSDLRLVSADYELLGRGRIDLAARDYDQEFVILRGADRLPEPVQRIGAGPHLAAAWLALRDALRPADGSGAELRTLRLRGSWDAPRLERAAAGR